MSTNIEWARNPDGSKGETWPVVTGCTPVSEGCRNCYAARMAATRLKHHPRYEGLATIENGRARWTGEVRCNYDVLEQPLRWRKPRMIFVASMGDLFHGDAPFRFISNIWGIMASHQRHIFQVLTKRPKRMSEFLNVHWRPWVYTPKVVPAGYCNEVILPNAWLGVSVENQAAADERREYLKQCPAAIKFVSYEPALGPIDWTGWEFVDQVISGGESGPGARPSHPDWHRATRDFCQVNGIAYFMKQWGRWLPDTEPIPVQEYEESPTYDWRDGRVSYRVGKKCAGHLLDGRTWQEFPELERKEKNE